MLYNWHNKYKNITLSVFKVDVISQLFMAVRFIFDRIIYFET